MIRDGAQAVGLLYGGLLLASERTATAFTVVADLQIPHLPVHLPVPIPFTDVRVPYCVEACDPYDPRDIYQLRLLRAAMQTRSPRA